MLSTYCVLHWAHAGDTVRGVLLHRIPEKCVQRVLSRKVLASFQGGCVVGLHNLLAGINLGVFKMYRAASFFSLIQDLWILSDSCGIQYPQGSLRQLSPRLCSFLSSLWSLLPSPPQLILTRMAAESSCVAMFCTRHIAHACWIGRALYLKVKKKKIVFLFIGPHPDFSSLQCSVVTITEELSAGDALTGTSSWVGTNQVLRWAQGWTAILNQSFPVERWTRVYLILRVSLECTV